MSWQLDALNAALRGIAKGRIARTADPEHAEKAMALASRTFLQPPFLAHSERPGGLHWIHVGNCVPGKAVLYLHGGGYVAGSPDTHRGMLGRISKLSQIEVCAPDYPLAQEDPFPAAFDAAVAAFQALRDLNYAPEDIVVGGDSAGGGLCLALLSWCCLQGLQPAGSFVFSPWTDLALTGESLRANNQSDPILTSDRIGELVDIYLQGADPRDPRASPLYADYPGCTPVLIQLSETEILRDDGLRMAERLRRFGADVEVQKEVSAPHVWQIFDGWLPEARTSLTSVADFIQRSFAAISR